jgi:uncharacterized protein (DUF885 family)
MRTLSSWLVAVLALTAGEAALAAAPVDRLVTDFVYGSLALSPGYATAVGYHRHQGRLLDEALDDFSSAGVKASRDFYESIGRRVRSIDQRNLDKEQRADLAIVSDAVELALLDLREIQSYRHNPTTYVELAGTALYSPFVLEYAPKEQRFQAIIRRLERLPALFAQATANLVDSPEVWNRVAREENDGTIGLVDKTLREAVPAAQRVAYDKAASGALAALRAFNQHLATTLAAHTSDWRLGKDLYERKCRYVLATGKTAAEMLAAAEADLEVMRAEMARLAAPQTVEQALAALAAAHSTPASYLDDARRDLEQAIAFVRAKDLVTLPPVFMRGSYPVGGFNPAPALEPQLGAFYWITPIPADWPAERRESKLREYNSSMLQHLTLHEAVPGHYLQAEYANDVQPASRRVLRAVYGNGPYVEGWAVYGQQLMTDEGYLGGDPGLRLSFLKMHLRAIANTILDVRMQTLGMTDQEALDLMIKRTYQEKEEAAAKVQRAQLSSCQLGMYYSGWKGWLEARAHDQTRRGAAFTLKSFHERALRESAVPLAVLDHLLE